MRNKRILIAPNSFKECADSVEIADILKNLIEGKGYDLIVKPISDGGDGFLDVCRKNFDLQTLSYEIETPYNESKFNCEAGYDAENRTLYIESALVLGMKVVPRNKRRPLFMNSKGMGDLLLAVGKDKQENKIDVEKIIIGIGGTATNDLGLGMCSRFGLKLYDAEGEELEPFPQNYNRVESIDRSMTPLPFDIEVVIDVENPLLGEKGAAKVFGQQKGLNFYEIEEVEKGFAKILNIIKYNKLELPFKGLSGAGGGLAAGFQIFFNAHVKKSSKFILEDLHFSSLNDLDAVITGEGAFDSQSLMNKAAGSIINIFKQRRTPVFLCCGIIDHEILKSIPSNVVPVEISKYFDDRSESVSNYKKGLEFAVADILRSIA